MNKENTGFLDVCGNQIFFDDIVVYCIDDSQLFRVQKYESGKYYLLGLVSGCRFPFDKIFTENEIEKP